MGLNNIEKLLDAYFEGRTSLGEEDLLMDYFCNHQVPIHLLQYKPIFIGLAAARKEQSERSFKFPESEAKRSTPWRYAVAGALVIALGIGSFYLSNPGLSAEEQEALTAFENSKEALRFLSENLNKGANQLSYVDEFEEAKNKVFKSD